MRVWQSFEPSADIGLAEYSIRKILNEEERPFDFLAFPHMVACGGPMDSFDSLYIREIVLQWASRLGKTFFILCGSLYMSELQPCNQMLAGPSQDIGLQQTERVRVMGKHIKKLREAGIEDTLKQRLRFNGNIIYAAWAKSPGTLSNVNILYGGASELDLFEHQTTSKHPDPEEMFRDRFKDNDNSRKVIFESIPTLKGTYLDHNDVEKPRSRIEARRLQGSDCSFWCGCPHCGHRQVIQIDNVTADGYECEGCHEIINDQYRKAFIRSGVWAPRGCTVDPDKATHAASERLRLLAEASELPEGHERLIELREALLWKGWTQCEYIIGEPANDCESASYQLGSLCALSLTWARIHEEKSTSRNFVNQWLAETYDLKEDEEYDIEFHAKELAHIITGELPRDTLPDWTAHIVLSCDRQKSSFPWTITAWDEGVERFNVIDQGDANSFSEIEKLLERTWGIERLSICVIDAGYETTETYDWCKEMTATHGIRCYPVMGTSGVSLHYKEVRIEDEHGRKSKYSSIRRLNINGQSTQEWVTKTLEQKTKIRLWKEIPAQHVALCEDYLNEVEHPRAASSEWKRRRESKKIGENYVRAGNDQRDCLRYAKCGALYSRDKPQKHASHAAVPIRETSEKRSGFIRETESGGFIRK